MELIGERIKELIKKNSWPSTGKFYDRIKELYPSTVLARYTLTRILGNRVKTIHERTLEQIAAALDIQKSVLRRGTTAEASIKKTSTKDFTYSGGSEVQVLEKNDFCIIEKLSLTNSSYRFLKTEFGDSSEISSEDLLKAIKKAGLPMPNKSKFRGDLNKLSFFLNMKNLHTKFPELKLPPEAINLKQQQKLNKTDLWKLNRIILETAFPNICPKIPQNRRRTDMEQDDPNAKDSLKWVFVMKGRLNLIIEINKEETKKLLKAGQNYSFDARHRHCFENLSIRSTKALIIHCPASNSIFYQKNISKNQ